MIQRFLFVLGAGALVAACGPRPVVVSSPAPDATISIVSAPTLIRAMHARYDGKWYRTLTFVQTSQYYNPQGAVARTETWYEAGRMPGMLRIDIGERSLGNGVLYRNDSSYQFQNGQLVRATRGRNPLMILGFDVHTQPPEVTTRVLAEEGFDTTKFHRAVANQTEYYVVGAVAGDTTSKQFWVEAARLLFWRYIEPPRVANGPVSEIRFQKYVPHGGGWVAEEVDFLRNGRRYFFEAYSDVRTDVPLDPALFDPAQWTTAPYWR